MKRKLSTFSSALSLNRARTAAANYRLVGRPSQVGTLPMARLSPTVTDLFWHPDLLDSLRVPLTRHRE